MEGIRTHSAAASRFAAALRTEHLLLLDVGCSGGIDGGWRVFGDRLSAIAIDCDEAEVQRLRAGETNPTIEYLAGMVALPADHPAARPLNKNYLHRRPAHRLSSQRTAFLRGAALTGKPPLTFEEYLRSVIHPGAAEPPEGFSRDYGRAAAFGGDAEGIVFLPRLLESRGFTDLDFLKIDIDGPDFDILRGMPDVLSQPGLLGVAAEVNFVGSHDADDHAFHNVDRLMREMGFDLFGLTVRRYSSAALPAPYESSEATVTVSGRPVQGDALYLRDLASPVNAAVAAQVTDDKLLKLGAIFALCNLPDEAAEMLIVHHDRLGPLVDVASLLDLLAAQVQEDNGTELSYRAWLEAFEAESPVVMNQHGRRAIWLQSLLEDRKALAAAAARIAELEQELAARALIANGA